MALGYDVRGLIFNDDPDNMERIGSPLFPITVVFLYVMFVKYVGPWMMEDRKPFQLKEILILHNFAIVLTNAYVSFKIGSYTYRHIHLMCVPRETVDVEYHVRNIFLYGWFYYLSKYADLLDTVFFVLRKKNRQISFLHVFHHSIIIILCWIGFYFKTRGLYLAFGIPLNSFVHVCTYTYYTLAAFGPHMQKYLWWKKYLTFFQVGQFVVALMFMFITIVIGCEKTDYLQVVVIFFTICLMFLFANFYNNNYKKKKH